MSFALALLSSALWGSADFFGGTLARRVPAYVVVGVSQAVGLVTMVAIAAATGAFTAPLGYLPWAVGSGIAGVAGLVAFYVALASGTMGVVSPIAALGVVVPVVVGLVRGESPSALALSGIGVAVVGVVLASGPELRGRAGARPLLLAAGAAVCFGLAVLCIAYGSRTSATMTMLSMRGVSTTAMGLLLLVRRERLGGVVPALPLLVAIGVADVLANLFFGIASVGSYVSVISVLGSLYPVATVLLAMGLHGERLARIQVAGVGAALAGVVLIAAG